MNLWFPRDGDAFTTHEGFVFYVFGYEHPAGRVVSFLKYILSDFHVLFQIRYLRRKWRLEGRTLVRAEKLYTTQNYKIIIEVFRKYFPDYVYYCPFRGKEIISVPLKSIDRFFEPKACLKRIMRKKSRDHVEASALELVSLLSEQSDVPLEDFGVHGSIALKMHTSESDIDLAIYGYRSFRRVEETIRRLVLNGELEYVAKNWIDRVRSHRGRYKDKIFNYNAVRKLGEAQFRYGERLYEPVKHVLFKCTVSNDEEAMFRPAIYKISSYCPLNDSSDLQKGEGPEEVVSMIGCYRNIARNGEKIRVSGKLERVKHVETGHVYYRVVVGTGTGEDEYIKPENM